MTNEQISDACERLVKAYNIATEELTGKQIAEALEQALLAGDFKRLVEVTNNGQTVIYVPYMGVNELRAENERLKQEIIDLENTIETL